MCTTLHDLGSLLSEEICKYDIKYAHVVDGVERIGSFGLRKKEVSQSTKEKS